MSRTTSTRSTRKAAPAKARKTAPAKARTTAPAKAATTTRKAAPAKAAAPTRMEKSTTAANAALFAGASPVSEGQSLSVREVTWYAEQLGAKAATKAAILKAAGLTLPQLRGFAEGREEGRGLSGLGANREAFAAFYKSVKAANPSPRVRPRKAAAALLGLYGTAR